MRRSCCRRSCCSPACRRVASRCGGAGPSSPSSRSRRSCGTSPRSSRSAARRESCWPRRRGSRTTRTRTAPSGGRARALGLAGLTVAAGALPIAIFGLVNRAFGEGFLPNSVTAKAVVGKGSAPCCPPSTAPCAPSSRTAWCSCPSLAAAAYLIWAWFGGPRGNVALATAFLVTALLHAAYADFHYFERYQAYLVIAGSFFLLRAGARGRAPGAQAGCARVRPRHRGGALDGRASPSPTTPRSR